MANFRKVDSDSDRYIVRNVLATQSNGGAPDLHLIVLFDETAKQACNRYKKGDIVWIKGKVRAYKFGGKARNEIWASEIDFIQ